METNPENTTLLVQRTDQMVQTHAELQRENHQHLRRVERAIAVAIKQAMGDYHRATGMHITKVDVTVFSHIHGRNVDMSVLSDVTVSSNFPSLG